MKSQKGLGEESEPNTARDRKIVGWVERKRYPTNPVKRWVSLPQPNLPALLLKAYPSSIEGEPIL